MLKIENLSKTFKTGIEQRTALDNVSLHVKNGDFITMIGSNGAGKSTLFNTIIGSVLPDKGKIILSGTDITFSSPHQRARKIGCLFQDPMRGTAPGMTVAQNLALAYHSGNWLAPLTKADKEYFYYKLKDIDIGLEDRLDRLVGLLSGGQRQALSLVMATINSPQLLLLDEHTAALDPYTTEKILDMTDRIIKENNLTCIMITHDMNSALQLGNRIVMMDNGRVLADIGKDEKSNMSIDDLIGFFKNSSHATDRVLLG